jgi:hypothetical protein
LLRTDIHCVVNKKDFLILSPLNRLLNFKTEIVFLFASKLFFTLHLRYIDFLHENSFFFTFYREESYFGELSLVGPPYAFCHMLAAAFCLPFVVCHQSPILYRLQSFHKFCNPHNFFPFQPRNFPFSV